MIGNDSPRKNLFEISKIIKNNKKYVTNKIPNHSPV